MQKYIIKRLLLFLPTLWIITLLGFYLSKLAPGDPVAIALGEIEQDRTINETAYIQKRIELGLDKPLFYFSFAALSETDTLYKIHRPQWRALASYLTFYTGNWTWVNDYLFYIQKLKSTILYDTSISSENKSILFSLIEQFVISKNETAIKEILQKIERYIPTSISKEDFKQLKNHVNNLENSKTIWKNYCYSFLWI